MALEKCKAEIVKALGRELTKREEGIVARRASALKDKIDRANNDPTTVTGILQDFADEAAARANVAKRSAALNYLAFAKQKAWHESVEPAVKNPGEVLMASVRGSIRNFPGAKDGAANLAQREMNARAYGLAGDLTKAGVMDYAYDPANNKAVGNALYDLRQGADPDSLATKYGALAAKVASILENAREKLRLDLNAAGAWISKNSDAIFRRTHDPVSIARAGGNLYGSDAAKAYWVQSVSKKMDWGKAFDGELAQSDDAERSKMLGDLWTQFSAGSHLQGDGAGYGVGPASTAKKWSHARQLAFKSADDEVAYLNEFGKGNSIAEIVEHELRSGGKDVALMRKFGPNWQATIDRLYQDRKEALVRANDVKGEAQLNTAYAKLQNNDLRLLNGQAGHPADSYVSRYITAGRVWTSAAAIANSIWALTGDTVIRASMVAQRSGGSMTGEILNNYLKQLMGSGLTREQQIARAAEMGIRFEGITAPLDPYLSEHIPEGAAAKAMQLTLKAGGHNWWVNRERVNSLAADSNHYWSLRGTTMADMPNGERGLLQQFGIDAKGWDALRGMDGADLGNGQKAFTPDGILKLDLAKFAGTTAQQTRARQALADSYRNLLGEIADRSTVSPSLALRARMGLGYAAVNDDTWHGAAWRGALALKGFVVNYLYHHLGRELHGYNPEFRTTTQALGDMMTGKNWPAAKGMSKLVVAGTLNFYVVNALKDMAMGKTPLDPSDWDSQKHGSFWETPGWNAFARAFGKQSLGLYGEILTGQGQRPGAGLLEGLAEKAIGPEAEAGIDVADQAVKLASQMGKRGGPTQKQLDSDSQRLFGTAWRTTPGTNLFWSKWATDYFIYNQFSDALNPGYRQRLRDRMNKQGQTYLLDGQ